MYKHGILNFAKIAGISISFLFTLTNIQAADIKYQYDELGRLVKVEDTHNGNRDYSYDPAGNRTTVAALTSGNSAPTANTDTMNVDSGQRKTISVLGNDTDPDGDTLVITSFTQPSYASVTMNSNYTFNVRANSTTSNKNTSFHYTISDGNGYTDRGTVIVYITGSNGLPEY